MAKPKLSAKMAWFIVLSGLAGAFTGVVVFYLTGQFTEDIMIRAATGGLFAVLAPLAIVYVLFLNLSSQDPE